MILSYQDELETSHGLDFHSEFFNSASVASSFACCYAYETMNHGQGCGRLDLKWRKQEQWVVSKGDRTITLMIIHRWTD